jgi:Tol biopolymer transport system component
MRNKVTAVLCLVLSGAVATAMTFDEWSPAVSVEALPGTHPLFNTASQDGCPAPSPDGLSLYMASNRPGGKGGLDIWVSTRESADDPWGEPVNAGAGINTPADEFCPTPLRDNHTLLFVSTRAGGCGGGDIYISRQHAKLGWQAPVNLGCTVNSAAEEASPQIVEYEDGRRELYFSSTRLGGFVADPAGATSGDSDIYVSEVGDDDTLAAPALAAGLNTEVNDFRPNIRRDGLEIFFDSNRAGGLGGLDIWSSVRTSTSDAWSLPTNAGPNVNSSANETRPFLSWGASTLYFGTMRAGVEGAADIFVTTRVKQHEQ